jgi:cysteine-rich repeat protein
MRRALAGVLIALGIVVPSHAAPPSNDACANATAVTSVPFDDHVDTLDATQEATDPRDPFNGGGPTVWYRFVPPASGTYCARSCGSDYDTTIAVVSACNGGTFYASDDDGCGMASNAIFSATAGVPVLIEVALRGAYAFPGRTGAEVLGGDLLFHVADASADSDGDGVLDCADDCPSAPNADQADADFDGVGDVCDPCVGDGADLDGDGICGGNDNCPRVANPGQEDSDGDGHGDVCDACPGVFGSVDRDGDGVCDDGGDNCPGIFNPTQIDQDNDSIGDACDRCPGELGTGTVDSDGDGRPDVCDACPNDPDDRCATLWACRGNGGITTGLDSMLLRMNPTTGAESFVGLMGVNGCNGLAFEPGTGVLYAVAVSPFVGPRTALYRVDTTTGATTRVGGLTGGGAFGDTGGDLAFRSDGALFATARFTSHLGRIDPTTGAVSDVGSSGPTNFFSQGIAFDAASTLYYADPTNLATLDPTTGAATTIAPFVYPAACGTISFIDALTFDGSGTLFGTLQCGFGSRLVTVNPATAALTTIGPTFHPARNILGITSEICGNGTREGGEECDDGNLVGGDCCSPTCTAEPAGSPCASDGDLCTADVCDGGRCAHLFPAVAGCSSAPPRRAPVTLVDAPEAKLSWRWRGTVTDALEFGPPTSATDLTLCIGDTSGHRFVSATVPQGGLCAGRPCWSPAPQGYDYLDRDRTPDGLEKITLRASPVPGKARIKLRARGTNLAIVGPPYSAPLRVRLLRNDTGACWEAAYSNPLRNDLTTFKARGD